MLKYDGARVQLIDRHAKTAIQRQRDRERFRGARERLIGDHVRDDTRLIHNLHAHIVIST
jgi:hypothetical protein